MKLPCAGTMSRSHHYHHHPQYANRPPVVVNDNDVLSGRGVNIAHHPGNERFRTLVSARADQSYCTSYSASEKRAVAEEIIKHIQSLDPPGRFLKREGRGQVSRGLNGPWDILSDRECIKKTCQALRDCNRQDRAGYAMGVAAPQDVKKEADKRGETGLSGKQQAAAAAAASAAAAAAAATATLKRREHPTAAHLPVAVGVPHVLPPHHHAPGPEIPGDRVSPTAEHAQHAAEWHANKKQRTDDGSAIPADSPVGADGMPLAPQPYPVAHAPVSGHPHHPQMAYHHDPAAMPHVYHYDPNAAHHHPPVAYPLPPPGHHHVPAQAMHHHAPVPMHHHAPVPAPAAMQYSPIADPSLAPAPHEAAPAPVAAPEASTHELPVPDVGPDAAAETDPLNNLIKDEAPPLNVAEL